MKKKIVLIFSVLLSVLMLIGCQSSNNVVSDTSDTEDKKLNVVVSFYPLAEFANAIGKDKVSVTTMIGENMEPHDFEPKTKDLENLIKSDVFVYNGAGMESWIDKVNDVVSEQNEKVLIVDSSKNADIRKENDAIDPHLWLSLKEAKKQCEVIKDAFCEKDSSNKEFYEKNYNDYTKQMDDLIDEYSKKFDTVKQKDFVTGHAAFGYLCRDFKLEQKSVENIFAEGEPTPKQLEDLVEYCKDNNIKTIFSEENASPKVSETLANEVGAEVKPINTLESKNDDYGYIEEMKQDLEEIYQSLKK
ncbi:zinc ABC transporter substrate-binding protein [Clostridium sp. BJN0001]|uniref:metal ABC transporter solute-binding protein, Zn/Mn family n=1 Tax=Clostridium sp. BJN0001 TaxID=2930219 RepID=UPI001FD1D7C3|nr:zinc ABC transporter substrate-binding protein [Clostridium sp. BJN0001]